MDFEYKMKTFLAHVLLIGILMIFSIRASADSMNLTLFTTDTSEKDEESAEHSLNDLQDNIGNGLDQLIELIQLTNSNLGNIRDKLNSLENSLKSQIQNSKVKRFIEVTQLSTKLLRLEQTQNIIQTNISSQATTISSLHSRNDKMRAALFERSPEAFLELLPPPKSGDSFNGSTFEAISANVPTDNMLVAQIKNYMDMDLTEYQLHLPKGFVAAAASNTISAKTTEIATFKANKHKDQAAQPEMSYRIGGTDISLHLYFITGGSARTFAAALLPRSAPAESIISFDCTKYKHSGTSGSHQCVTNVDDDTTRKLTVYEGDIFLKVTFYAKSFPGPGTLSCEVFKLAV